MPNLKAVVKYVDYGRAIGALLDVKSIWGDKDEYPDEVIDRCIRALESLPTIDPEELRPKWISVKDRKPESGSRCLVARYDYVTKSAFVDILWYDKGNWWNRQYQGNFAVTHWMPLPEPPEGGAEV